VQSYPRPITSGQELSELPGIGAKTIANIQEFIDTVRTSAAHLTQGTCKRLTDDAADKRDIAINLFSKVDGIGPLAARAFVEGTGLR
jgi:DNA polymerase/3'-5' exonuclease PolX